MGVFLGITAEEPPRLLSLQVHLRSQKAWRDTITVLYVMDGIVLLFWRRALLGEKEMVFHLGTSYFAQESPCASLENADGGVKMVA